MAGAFDPGAFDPGAFDTGDGAALGDVVNTLDDSIATITAVALASASVSGVLDGSTPSIQASAVVSASVSATLEGSIPDVTALSSGGLITATLVSLLDGSSPSFTAITSDPFAQSSGVGERSLSAIVAVATFGPFIPRFLTMKRLIGVWTDGTDLAPGVPLRTEVPIDWPRGTTSNIEIEIVDQDGKPFDIDVLIPGNSVELTVRREIASDPVLIVSATPTGDPGAYIWQVSSSMTIDLDGLFVYDVWATVSGAQRQVVATSYFNIASRIRR